MLGEDVPVRLAGRDTKPGGTVLDRQVRKGHVKERGAVRVIGGVREQPVTEFEKFRGVVGGNAGGTVTKRDFTCRQSVLQQLPVFTN